MVDFVEAFRIALFGDPPSPTYEPSREAMLSALEQFYNDTLDADAVLTADIESIITQLSTGIIPFETKALMDADTTRTDGTRASVWGDATAENNTFYIWDDGAGAWTEDANFIALITGPAGADGLMAAADAAAIDAGTDDTLAATPLGLADSQVTLKIITNDEWDFALVNDRSEIFLGVRNGQVEIAQATETTAIPQPPLAEMIGIPSYGQSLSMGGSDDDGEPLVSTVQEYDSVKFVQGTRTWVGAPASVAAAHASLVPLVENTDGTYGETPLSGACSMVNQLVISEDGRTLADKGFTLLASAPGFGSQSVTDLSKGSIYYQYVLDDIQYGIERADDLDMSYDVPVIFYTQGEADYSSGTSRPDWADLVRQLRNDLQADAGAAMLGREAAIRFAGYQIASHTFYNKTVPAIALAQLDMHIAGDYTIATPAYFLPYVTTGAAAGLHMTPLSYRILGAYYGQAFKRMVFDGELYECLRPTTHLLNGRHVLIEFITDTQLVFDTATVTDPGNYGFDAVDEFGAALVIDAVEIVGLNRVKFTFASNFPAGGKIRCGFTGASGAQAGPTTGARCNLRDSQGDTVIFDPAGTNYPMHRWCVFFEETIG